MPPMVRRRHCARSLAAPAAKASGFSANAPELDPAGWDATLGGQRAIPMTNLEGQTFAGYEIVSKCGEGGMGSVWMARR